MKTQFNRHLLRLYSPMVQMKLKQVNESKENLSLLIFEGVDWRSGSDVQADAGSEHWDNIIKEAEDGLKQCKKALFAQIAKESFLPFALLAGMALIWGGVI